MQNFWKIQAQKQQGPPLARSCQDTRRSGVSGKYLGLFRVEDCTFDVVFKMLSPKSWKVDRGRSVIVKRKLNVEVRVWVKKEEKKKKKTKTKKKM